MAEACEALDCAERDELNVSWELRELVLSRVSNEDTDGARNIEKLPDELPDELRLRELALEP
jgi:hypothetical protein